MFTIVASTQRTFLQNFSPFACVGHPASGAHLGVLAGVILTHMLMLSAVFPLPGVQTEQRTRGRFCRLVCGTTPIHLPAKERPPCDVKHSVVNLNQLSQLHTSTTSKQIHSWWLIVNTGKTQCRASAFMPNSHESNKYNNRIHC